MKHKILLVLLLSSMACITATAQKVSMDFRQVKLAKVFDAITQQTGLTVAYSRPTVNPDKLVTSSPPNPFQRAAKNSLFFGSSTQAEEGDRLRLGNETSCL